MQKNSFAITVVITTVLILITALVLQTIPAPQTALAQEVESDAPQRYVTVVGEGTVNIKPNIAKTTIGVETIKLSVKEASDENREVLVNVLDALRAAGVADNDMQTAGFNIYTEQFGTSVDGTADMPQVRYHVTNQVQIVIRDMEKVGEILDAAIEAGANSTYGIEFQLDDQKSARSEARSLAVENAGNKAAELAGLADVSVGEVLSVSEIIGNSMYYSGAESRYGLGGGGGTPISAGELQLTVQVQVTYALE